MHVLAVNTMDRSGGAEKIASDLVTGFGEFAHSASLAVGRSRGGIANLLIPQHRDYQTKNNMAPKPATEKIRNSEYLNGIEDFNFPGTWDLLNLESKQADILHLHNLHGGYFDLRALPWLSRQQPTVLTMHDAWLTSGHCAHSINCDRWLNGCGNCPDLEIYPSIPVDGTAFNWRRKSEIIANSRLHIITPSRWLMEKCKASIIWPHILSNKVIPNGVDHSIYFEGSKVEARHQLGLPDNCVILLSVLNAIKNNPFKDFDANLRVINWLSKRYPDQSIYWICLGSKGPTTEIGNATAIFMPYQDSEQVIATFYRAADIFLHLAKADTFPNVVIEALSCGCPVASTIVGGIPEQVNSLLPHPGESGPTTFDEEVATGVLVKAGDDREMVNQLVNLLSSPDLMRKLGKNAAKDGKRRFNINVTIEKYLDWFSTILASQSQSKNGRNSLGISQQLQKNQYRSFSSTKTTRKPPIILMYHRVKEISTDPQLLAVKPTTFKNHLKFIKQISQPISLSEMIDHISAGDLPWNTVALTFDDGYADNFIEALPLLSEQNIPATIFGVSGAINSQQELWWDWLENIFLTPGILPQNSIIEIGDIAINVDLGEYAKYSQDHAIANSHWSVLNPYDPSPRHVIYRKLHGILRSIQNVNLRFEYMAKITKWANKDLTMRESHRPLTSIELKKLSDSDLVDIGGHTVSHPILSDLSLENQRHEILEGKKQLEKTMGQTVDLFAYPYGNKTSYTHETKNILKKNNFKGAVTSSEAAINVNTDIFELPRITIRNWNINQLREKLISFRTDHLVPSE